jgi:hypothetical protein
VILVNTLKSDAGHIERGSDCKQFCICMYWMNGKSIEKHRCGILKKLIAHMLWRGKLEGNRETIFNFSLGSVFLLV